MNGAPEQTIHRKSEGDNKSERKRWRSMAVIMSMSGVTMEVSGCDDYVAWNWRWKWVKLTLIVGSHDRRSWNFPTKMYYYASPTLKSETKLPFKNNNNKTTCCKHLRQREEDWESSRKVAYVCNFVKRPEQENIKTCTTWKKKDCSIVPYILKVLLRLLWPHETVLQTSATNIQNRKVSNYFSDGVVVLGPTA